MKKIIVSIVAITAIFWSCKKEDAEPGTSKEFKISLSGQFEEQYLDVYDTIDIVFSGSDKDKTVEFLGEKRIQYPNYDSTMILCSPLDYNAFIFTGDNSFTVKAGEKITKQIVFDPSNFYYSKRTLVVEGPKEGGCEVCKTNEVVIPSCQNINSNGIGDFKSILQFKIGDETMNINVNAKTKAPSKEETVEGVEVIQEF